MKKEQILRGLAILLVIVIFAMLGIALWQNRIIKSVRLENPELMVEKTYEEFEDGDEAVEGTDNVKFSAFFLRDLNGDGYAEKIKGTCKNVNGSDILYMEIKVENEGYFENGKININGENFNLKTVIPKDNIMKDNYIGDDVSVLEFERINYGTQKLLTGIIGKDFSKKNINIYSSNNKIVLTGTYVKNDNERVNIHKEIDLKVDWYGTVTTYLSNAYQADRVFERSVDSNGEFVLVNFTVSAIERNEQLFLKKNNVKMKIPDIYGLSPIDVIVENGSTTYTYDKDTSELIA